jgi:hypothetical protein
MESGNGISTAIHRQMPVVVENRTALKGTVREKFDSFVHELLA